MSVIWTIGSIGSRSKPRQKFRDGGVIGDPLACQFGGQLGTLGGRQSRGLDGFDLRGLRLTDAAIVRERAEVVSQDGGGFIRRNAVTCGADERVAIREWGISAYSARLTRRRVPPLSFPCSL